MLPKGLGKMKKFDFGEGLLKYFSGVNKIVFPWKTQPKFDKICLGSVFSDLGIPWFFKFTVIKKDTVIFGQVSVNFTAKKSNRDARDP